VTRHPSAEWLAQQIVEAFRGTRRRPIWCATIDGAYGRLSHIDPGRWGFETGRYHRGLGRHHPRQRLWAQRPWKRDPGLITDLISESVRQLSIRQRWPGRQGASVPADVAVEPYTGATRYPLDPLQPSPMPPQPNDDKEAK